MWRGSDFIPSWSSLNGLSCILIGATYLAVLGMIVWLIIDFEMPLIAMGWHR